MIVRPFSPDDTEALVTLWEAGVRATHSFLTEDEITFYRPYVRDGLGVQDIWVAEDDGAPVGFIGLSGAKVEMLFVDPVRHGEGIGRMCLDLARALNGPLTVDVSEEVLGNLAFYSKCGFEVTGRSELDGSGRPHPLIHMAQV